ncbi:DUF7115 domain-containing protein [Natrialbaceae archaeon AArc-T1-2]|uniref:DUF7115 domain-containing protein n=1 Tax=Natrialbaceae archaeon AArc-T1-2 TaxID=3053904 RepID=UPI00255AECDC|nr:hypothetical protein [Natrialbaceae archaeon AArc-T1-2]WIV67901.1 hypothetical protein QQ977_03995 [Natrialbaceae archaeon AArc-T1-2]
MNVPGIVQSTLDDEEIAARASLGGDDELFITPTRTIIYRADGLLSDESVDDYPHDAERVTLSEGRRKTRITLEYPLEGTREFTVPSSRTETVLHPVLAGILNGNDITDPGETVAKTYRFSELTLIITSDRIVKHIGEAVWDGDFEQHHFDDVTNLSFEDGSVATQIVLEVDGRQQRIKAPNDQADEVREHLEQALFEYYDVTSLEELNEYVAPDDDDERTDDPADAFGDGVDPLGTSGSEVDTPAGTNTTDAGADPDPLSSTDDPLSSVGDETAGNAEAASTDGRNSSAVHETDKNLAGETPDADATTGGGVAASVERPVANDRRSTAGRDGAIGSDAHGRLSDPELRERIADLEATVSRQNELLERHQRTIEKLIEELRQGR